VVVEMTRRHRNFAVLRGGGPGLFVKKIQPDQPLAAHTLRREAAFYSLLGGDPALAELRALLPRFHAYDSDRHILILEMVAGGEDVGALHRRLGHFPPETGALLGQALALCHRLGRELAGRVQVAIFPRQPPWILGLHQQPAGGGDGRSGGDSQLARVLRSYPEFPPALDALRLSWRCDTLIHGDMKFENCLMAEENLRLVDWEIADLGDPAWDAGSIFQCYLLWWLASMPPGGVAAGGSAGADPATFPLATIQPAMRAFWAAYTAGSGLSGGAAEAELERAASFAGARLLQSVYEAMAVHPVLTPTAVLELQVAANILTQPRLAALDLLGIRPVLHG
jgi:hypothetical protein